MREHAGERQLKVLVIALILAIGCSLTVWSWASEGVEQQAVVPQPAAREQLATVGPDGMPVPDPDALARWLAKRAERRAASREVVTYSDGTLAVAGVESLRLSSIAAKTASGQKVVGCIHRPEDVATFYETVNQQDRQDLQEEQ